MNLRHDLGDGGGAGVPRVVGRSRAVVVELVVLLHTWNHIASISVASLIPMNPGLLGHPRVGHRSRPLLYSLGL